MQFSGKNILLISPEKWGNMYVSKHHYALELARRGNQVYFLGPPATNLPNKFMVLSGPIPEIHIVTYWRPKWFFLRFHHRLLFHQLMKKQIKKLVKFLHIHIDIVWSFDNVSLYPDLRIFGADVNIFFLVDQINTQHIQEYNHLRGNIFSVSPVILKTFVNTQICKALLPHGLATWYANLAKTRLSELIQGNIFISPDYPVKAGYVGNLLIGKILDRNILQKVIEQHPVVEFHFWGAYQITSNNLGGDMDEELFGFIQFLLQQPNVVVHGATLPEKLSTELQEMDILMACYDYRFDKNQCSNSHKMVEYLSTGKVVVSTRITAYDEHHDLLAMLDTFDNLKYPELFSKVVNQIESYNSINLQIQRICFALERTYAANIDRIETLLSIAVRPSE